MNDILLEILYVIISFILTVAAAFVIRYINAKTDSQYKDEVNDAVTAAVTYVQQVYVDRAKAAGSFEKQNQVEALNMAVTTAAALLTPEASNYLHRRRTEGEANDYLKTLIEEAVRIQKKKEGK